MKKLVFVGLFLILSCSKEQTSDVAEISDTSNTGSAKEIIDSAENETQANLDTTVVDSQPADDGSEIVKMISGDGIPLELTEEFTSDQQQFIIKIRDFTGSNISAAIIPEKPSMNIRFNQIKLPNGEYDGPFGREISYKIQQNGEIWLIVGKSNMASGTARGKFKVVIE